MAYNNYFVQFACPVNTVLTEIQLDGVNFPLTPFAINLASPTLVADLNAILNAVVSSAHFGVEVSGTDLIIRNACQNLYTVDSVFVNSGGLGVITEEAFTLNACTIVTQCSFDGDMTASLNFDCDTQRFTFIDTTGDYSATNLGGYGSPNNISRSQILSADFVLTNGTIILGTYCTSNYLPNADGTSSIEFDATRFGLSAFTPNETYFIQYRLNMDDGTQEICINAEVLIPCCGSSILSNNIITFSVTEKIGCFSFDFEDTSGVYNVNTNPGGYGTPNYDYSDITSTLIRVTLSDGTVHDITTFIPTALNPTITIYGYQIGYGSAGSPVVIASQVATIEYFVYTSLNCRIGYMKQVVLFHCQLKACINSRAIEVLVADCDSCGEGDTDKVTEMLLQYQAILITSKTNIACLGSTIADLLFECQKGCNDC